MRPSEHGCSEKQDDQEEGEEITPDNLMWAGKNKYDAMVEKRTWNALLAEERKVCHFTWTTGIINHVIYE